MIIDKKQLSLWSIRCMLICLIFILYHSTNLSSQSLYFPPIGSNNWSTVSPVSLGWCPEYLNSLYEYLDAEESKAFIVLKDGKIVLEKYFDSFTADSLWYWASAGKTLTAFLMGMAQQEGLLNLNDPGSKYLGAGWTTESSLQESRITIRHQLTMTSGLEDNLPDNHCVLPSCLLYKADAGTRWAYHNAPYTLLRDVLENASGQSENQFIQNHLKTRTGMNGLWITSGSDNVYLSNARSMARFGLLVLNHGVWNADSLMKDQDYYQAMIHTSQQLNKSYGYLWWLNGKESFRLPGLQFEFPGPIMTQAPAGMFAGIGKNGQLLCIVPEENLVVLRLGESNGNGDEVSLILGNQIWSWMNKIRCNITVNKEAAFRSCKIYPEPAGNYLLLDTGDEQVNGEISIYNTLGNRLLSQVYQGQIDIHFFPPGVYFLTLKAGKENKIFRFIKA